MRSSGGRWKKRINVWRASGMMVGGVEGDKRGGS